MIDARRYTSGRIALANLSSSIEGLELRRLQRAAFEDLVELSKLLLLRGDLLGRIADHDRAEQIANEAVALCPDVARSCYMRARLAERFHRFHEANALLSEALAAGHPESEIDGARAALCQAVGNYTVALALRRRLAEADARIDTLGGLASLHADMDQWAAAETCYEAALDADDHVSPLPCSQLLFEWGVSAMRHGNLDRAEQLFAELATIVPSHVPGRGHRAEVALARGQLQIAAALIAPLVELSDDPEYRATHAEILALRGERAAAARESELAATGYELLLERRPEAYADHAAAFFMGVGNRPLRAVELASENFKLRNTPRSRKLLIRALREAEQSAREPPQSVHSCREELA